jgi:hypothetical protein
MKQSEAIQSLAKALVRKKASKGGKLKYPKLKPGKVSPR